MRRFVLATLVTLALWLTAAPAEAQFIGTYRWQLFPFCNVFVLNISQVGLAFDVTGWDDQCGAPTRDAVYGTMFFSLAGIQGGLTAIQASGQAAHLDISLNGVTLRGTWRASGGNSGTFIPR